LNAFNERFDADVDFVFHKPSLVLMSEISIYETSKKSSLVLPAPEG
jgi:hypothetical protein